MSANSFGHIFKMSTFGESHGTALGVLIEGCPAGVSFNTDLLIAELRRRRPGSSAIVSGRQEEDQPEVLSGVFGSKTLGTPIAIIVRNVDARSQDYNEIKQAPRKGHADDMWLGKFGHVDHRGGGRSSGRETLCRVIAGAVAKMLLMQLAPELSLFGFAKQIGEIALSPEELKLINKNSGIDDFPARLPNKKKSEAVERLLLDAKQNGRSYGGLVQIIIEKPPAFLGQPVFHKLKSDLAQAMMSVGATSGFSIGDGFSVVTQEGSEFHGSPDQDKYGGIRGGISTGERIHFEVSFKPTATVLDTAKKGRHDPCIVPRAIPVLEAMTYIVLADHLLWSRLDRV